MVDSGQFRDENSFEEIQKQHIHLIPCKSKSPKPPGSPYQNGHNGFEECSRSYRSSSSEPPSLSDFPVDDDQSCSSGSIRSPSSPRNHSLNESSDEEPAFPVDIDPFDSSDSEEPTSYRSNRVPTPDFKLDLRNFMDTAYSQVDAIYNSVPPEKLQYFHEEVMKIATELAKEKYKNVPED